jgi:hypothetical protein
MTNTKDYLNKKSVESIRAQKAIEPMENPFKNYHPLDKGNSKLYKNIASFSLLPYVTCPMKCGRCYDIKSLRYQSVRDKRLYNTYLAINEIETLKSLIIKQIKNSRTIEYIRIHVGGDFFSSSYVMMWLEIKHWIDRNRPNIKVYTYTKTTHREVLVNHGINVIESILPNGKFNYAKLEILKEYQKNNPEYSICPAYKANPNYKKVICGKTCKLCMSQSKVLFVEH